MYTKSLYRQITKNMSHDKIKHINIQLISTIAIFKISLEILIILVG